MQVKVAGIAWEKERDYHNLAEAIGVKLIQLFR